MPGKSRRGRRRYPSRSKKGKARQVPSAIVAQRQAATQSYEPVSRPDVSAPSARLPTPMAVLTTVRYPYIFTELRRIGILAGIMLVILVVLALILA